MLSIKIDLVELLVEEKAVFGAETDKTCVTKSHKCKTEGKAYQDNIKGLSGEASVKLQKLVESPNIHRNQGSYCKYTIKNQK